MHADNPAFKPVEVRASEITVIGVVVQVMTEKGETVNWGRSRCCQRLLSAAAMVLLASCGASGAATVPPAGMSSAQTSVTSVFIVVTATPLAPTPTATPNADATVQARVVATIAALPTASPVPPTLVPATPSPRPTVAPTATPATEQGPLSPAPDKPQIAIAALSGTSFPVHATRFLPSEALTEDLSPAAGVCLTGGQPCEWHFTADANGAFDHDADFSGLPSGQYWYSLHGNTSARFAPTRAITISDPRPVLPMPTATPAPAMARCKALASIVNAPLGLDSLVQFQTTPGQLAPSGATICGIHNNDGSYYAVYDYGLFHTYGHALCQSL